MTEDRGRETDDGRRLSSVFHLPFPNKWLLATLRKRDISAELEGAPYWMDSALMAAHDIPTVVFGPAGGGLHSAEEWVDLESVEECLDVLVEVGVALGDYYGRTILFGASQDSHFMKTRDSCMQTR